MSDAGPDPRAACLPEQVLLEFAGGRLSGPARDRADQHLDGCVECQLELAEAVRALQESAEPVRAALLTTFRSGARVAGRYRIERFVARGGMGEVYAAHDEQLDERVALKTINAAAADDIKAIRRLKAEVQLARRVSHPHACRIYDLGEHVLPEQAGARVHFLSMEFIEGRTLGARLRSEGRMPVHEVLIASRQVLDALSAAHAVGVLHRDFKSDNVMLRSSSPRGLALDATILDFGLARALGDARDRITSHTQALLGSAAYMAPEQVLAERDLTAAVDVYAFGVVLFEMLTGQLPFRSDSPIATANQRLHKPPPKPSSVVPELGRHWDDLVLGCLARNVKQRPANAEEVLARLPGAAPPRSWRRPLGFTIGGFAAGLGVASLWAGFQTREPAPDRDTASLRPAPLSPTNETPTSEPVPLERAASAQSFAPSSTERTAPEARAAGAPAKARPPRPRRPAASPGSAVRHALVGGGARSDAGTPARQESSSASAARERRLPPSQDPYDGLYVPSQ